MYVDDCFMDDNDVISYANTQEYNELMNKSKKMDKGYSSFRRNGVKYEMYTSGDTGTNIRDAVTGMYYKNKVGSSDEFLFFKVSMLTGECSSRNGSNILFYASPEQYMSHIGCEVDIETYNNYQTNSKMRLKELEKTPPRFNGSNIVVK
jgi:hypothetical protein